MVDSASKSKNLSDSSFYDFSAQSNKLVMEKFMKNMESAGNLSDAEIKFLSLSKEKRSSREIIDRILYSEMTLENFKEILCLQDYIAYGGTINPNQTVRNIRYKNKSGNIVAIIQIDTINKKIRMQNLGNVLPIQECFTPSQVGIKIQNLAKFNHWTTEDGGINQFNGNIEVRYKDADENVMAAVIKKNNGIFDTIAEYEYSSGYKSKMLLTNTNGQSVVIYDGSPEVNQATRLDIDNSGFIFEITKSYSE